MLSRQMVGESSFACDNSILKLFGGMVNSAWRPCSAAYIVYTIHFGKLKQITTTTVTGMSLNKTFIEQSNSCARAF